jgi:hypothetical protein
MSDLRYGLNVPLNLPQFNEILFICTVYKPAEARVIPPYAELHCVSNFSFLRGASHPEELVDRAKAQSYAALALTDECSLAGVVRAHLQAKATGLPLLIGAQFGLHGLFGHPHTAVEPASQRPAGGPPDAKDGRTQNTRAAPADARIPPARLVLIAQNREGYGNLSALITHARMRAAKGHYRLLTEDLDTGVPGCLALLVPCPEVATQAADETAEPVCTRRRASSASASVAAPGWQPSCWHAVTTCPCWPGCVRPLGTAACRWSPRAMCTTTCAHAGACTTS